jgi:hypothetical protein
MYREKNMYNRVYKEISSREFYHVFHQGCLYKEKDGGAVQY